MCRSHEWHSAEKLFWMRQSFEINWGLSPWGATIRESLLSIHTRFKIGGICCRHATTFVGKPSDTTSEWASVSWLFAFQGLKSDIAYLVPVFSLWLGSWKICTSRLWVFNHLGVSASKFIALSRSSSPKGSNTTLWNRRQYPIQIYCNWTSFSQLAVFELGKVKGPNAGPWRLGTQALTVAWEVRTSCLRAFYHHDLSAFTYRLQVVGAFF